MKTTVKFLFAFFAVFIAVGAANAQASGTGTIGFNVTVPNAVDLRSNGAATGSAAGFGVSQSQSGNDALGVTLTLADASPNVDNSTLNAMVPIRMRSNTTYKLNATRSTTEGISSDFDASDIQMSIDPVTRSGAKVASGADTIASGFDSVGKLSQSSQTILSGDRISNEGDNLSPDNFATTNLKFAVKRQYYTATSAPYVVAVTLAIAAP